MIPLKKWFRSPGRDLGPAGEARIRVEPRIPGSNGAPPPERRSSVPHPKGLQPQQAGRGSMMKLFNRTPWTARWTRHSGAAGGSGR